MILLLIIFFHFSPSNSQINGRLVFDSQCRKCHTIGGGDDIAPDLMGISQRRYRSWLQQWIASPEKVISSQDKYALNLLNRFKFLMPNVHLNSAEVEAVIDYLEGIGQGVWSGDQNYLSGSPPAQIYFFRQTHALFFNIPKAKSSCLQCHPFMYR